MASINGITVKGLKKFRGHEGEPCYQGTVYVDGMKMGWWSQDSHGGPDIMDFDQSYLNKEVEAYRNSDRVEDEYREYTELDSLLCDLIEVMEIEKAYKGFVKKGRPTMVEATDGYHASCYGTCATRDEDILNSGYHADFIRKFTQGAFKNCKVKVSIYKSLDDFNIVC